MMRYGRDGEPRPDGMMRALELDAVALLRTPGPTAKAMKERLSARAYLLGKGWTVDEVNAAAEAAGEGGE